MTKWLKATAMSDRAISSLIGTLVMVALAVVLGAVLGTVAFDVLGAMTKPPAPQTDITIEDAGANYHPSDNESQAFVRLRNERGDRIDTEELRLVIQTEPKGKPIFAWENGMVTNKAGTGNWTVTINGDPMQSQKWFAREDVIVISYDDEGMPTPKVSDESKYTVMVIDSETGNPIAETTTEVR